MTRLNTQKSIKRGWVIIINIEKDITNTNKHIRTQYNTNLQLKRKATNLLDNENISQQDFAQPYTAI